MSKSTKRKPNIKAKSEYKKVGVLPIRIVWSIVHTCINSTGMIVMFIFNNYTMNLCCLWADGQWLSEAQPSWLSPIDNDCELSNCFNSVEGRICNTPLGWFILNTFRICWLIISYAVLMSCETAIHSCWWWQTLV